MPHEMFYGHKAPKTLCLHGNQLYLLGLSETNALLMPSLSGSALPSTFYFLADSLSLRLLFLSLL